MEVDGRGDGRASASNQVLVEKEGKGRKEEEHMYLSKEERGLCFFLQDLVLPRRELKPKQQSQCRRRGLSSWNAHITPVNSVKVYCGTSSSVVRW